MLLKNTRRTNISDNGNIVNQFNNFRNQLLQSGRNPQDILNELVSSGKVSKSQLDNITKMAKSMSYLLK